MTLIDQIKAALQGVANTVGTPVNWATQFTNQLNTPVTAAGADETKAGVVQFATAAEVVAGTVANKGISPLRLAGLQATESLAGIHRFATAAEVLAGTAAGVGVSPLQLAGAISTNQRVYQVTSLAALKALGDSWYAAGRDGGELVSLKNAALGSGQINYGLYFWYAGAFYIVGTVYLSGGATLAQYVAYTNVTTNRVQQADGAFINTAGDGLLYQWGPGGWLQIKERVLTQGANGTSNGDWQFLNNVQPWDPSSFTNELRVVAGGTRIEITLGARKDGSYGNWLNGDPILQIASAYRTKRPYQPMVTGYGSTSGWPQGIVPMQCSTDGILKINGVGANTTGLFGTFQLPIT